MAAPPEQSARDVQTQLAMARVLAAERDAREAVAQAAAEAERLRAAARATEREIAARAANRATAVRDAMARRLAADLARIGAAIDAERSAPATQPGDGERVRRAVEALASELTGP